MGKRNWQNKRKHVRSRPYNQHHRKQSKNSSQKSFSREPIVKNNLKETEVGIEEFTGNHPGFTGVIKARFSDFHVNEIDLNGREIKLTNLEVPEPTEDEMKSGELEKAKEDLKGTITPEVWNKIDELLESKENSVQSVEIDVTNIDKEKRTMVHKSFKKHYGAAINSTTINKDEKKLIQVTKSKDGTEKRSRWLWPGEYTYFVVHKENIDTIQAASDLAQHLRMQISCVNYAGTKDKRAKTSQLFCIKKRDPSQIVNASKRFPYMKVGNFEFQSKVLKLGELKGNRFRIALRNVVGENAVIEQSLVNLQNNGFINYYGLQRFGNCADIPTYKIGIALLKSDFKEACELILKPREGDHPILREAREMWWKNRNSAEALSVIGNKKCVEKHLLEGLADFGENDYATALKRIPRNMLMMYTHSFQSLIWNRIASRRIREFGLKLISGDLVYKDDQEVTTCNVLDAIEETVECLNEIPVDNDLIEQVSEFKAKVRPLTDNDISSDKYTIFDIVLPLPGYDITYPSNIVGKWYEEILAEENLSSEKLRHNVKTYSLAGSYRKLVIKPENMKWQFKKYDSVEALIASDYEELKGINVQNDIPEGKFKALLLDFILPGSSYATMGLRELLKNDTSPFSQSELMKEMEQKYNKESCSSNKLNDDNDNCNEKEDNTEDGKGINASEDKLKESSSDDEADCMETKKIKLDS